MYICEERWCEQFITVSFGIYRSHKIGNTSVQFSDARRLSSFRFSNLQDQPANSLRFDILFLLDIQPITTDIL